MANAWHMTVGDVPVASVPSGLRYAKGYVDKTRQPAIAWFTFDLATTRRSAADTVPIDLSIQPASNASAASTGVVRRLPSGRMYVDLSMPGRDGPFVEHLGPYEIEVQFELIGHPRPGVPLPFMDEHSLRLQVLDSVDLQP